MLHWAQGAGGKGALLSAISCRSGPDRKVSFMRSYPDLIPLDARSVQHIAEVLQPWPFDPIYGAWWDRVIAGGGKQAMDYSVQRYLRAISAPPRGVMSADASWRAPASRVMAGGGPEVPSRRVKARRNASWRPQARHP